MKISLNWIKQFIDFELPPVEELVERIGAQLGAVEEVENLGKKYQGVLVAKVVSCVDHPDSDHLHICMIDDGGKAQDVERDADGHVQVVCGAPNVREGLTVAWLPPGSTVPESVGKDPFVLGKRELRGVMSNGMIASARELALGDNHEGILEIDKEAEPGSDFAGVYKLDDYVIDIENKMFTHRPDCFGALGVAREIAGISHKPFTSPDWYKTVPPFPTADGLALEVANEASELVPRFMALPIRNVTIKPSPVWLQVALAKLGQKSVNNVVDATNFVMLLTAQPTHAYDYDKLRGHRLLARMAKPDEQMTLLNHKTYRLDPADIVIADGEGAVGLAGVMGGGDSEVSDQTTNIVLECATFDMYAVRRSAMRHGVFTDALTRFNKGQSPLQNGYVLGYLVDMITELAGGEVAGPVYDLNQAEGREWLHPPVPVTTGFINTRLGFDLSADEMKTLLENVEFNVEVEGDKLTVTAPFWRTDVETREDVVEEIGRLYGFDKLPLELPKRSIKPTNKDDLLELKQYIREHLAKAGANEVLTYSFVHGDLLQKAGQSPDHAFRIANALSPDLQYYRTGLTASLLDKVHMNIKAGYGAFALFELGKVHYVGEMDALEAHIPNEDNHLALVIAYGDKDRPAGVPYYHARKYLAQLVDLESVAVTPLADFDFSADEWGRQLTAPYEPGRSAAIVRDGQIWGVVGELKASVRRALKLPAFSAAFEVHLDMITRHDTSYVPLPRFPKVTQDITLKVAADLPYRQLLDFVQSELAKARPPQTFPTLTPLGIYQRDDDPSHKQVTFRLAIASFEKTMTDAEVNTLLDAVAAAAKTSLGAERV